MSCDPNFGQVALLLPFDGSIVDISSNALPITLHGATTESSQVFAGTGALNLPQASAYASTPITAGSPLDLGSSQQDWTLECFVYLNIAFPGGNGMELMAAEDNQTNPAFPTLVAEELGGNIVLAAGIFGAGLQGLVPAATWTHVAHTRQSNQYTLWINGINVASVASIASVTAGLVPFFVGPFHFNGGDPQSVTGFMDEVRVTNGLARYTSNFTPPTSAFPTISCTQTVPDVIGLTDVAAQAAIIAGNFTVGTISTGINPAPPGVVFAQSPVGGTIGTAGDPVDITESEGVLVPDVTNTSFALIAPGLITGAGFTVGTVTYAASGVIVAGNVVSQSPVGGSFAADGSAINLIVSTGLPALTVPDIFGLSQADAETALTSLGLVIGAVSSAPSKFVPPNLVQAQNPTAGTAVAVGTIVSFVLSLGNPAVATAFDFEATVISQYANSPTILQLVSNLNSYIDQSTNFANFYNFVWNVDTAVGFGLDIWGKIVGVSRLLHIPTTVDYVGFDNSATPPPDWQTMGSDQDDPPVGGAMYTGYNATQTYLLPDDAYRQLILAKAFANICTTTAPAINQILQNLYGPGTAWVLNTGTMAISYNLNFHPSAIQLAILEQSGVIPTPPGVSVTVIAP